MKKVRKGDKKQPSPTPPNRFGLGAVVVIAGAAVVIAIVAIVMTAANGPNHSPRIPAAAMGDLHRAAREKFFSQAGYAHYETMKEVPWLEVLAPDDDWSDDNRKTVDMCLTLLAAVAGESDPAVRTVRKTEKNGGPLRTLVPLDRRIAIGTGRNVEFVDALWSPNTRCIHLRRDAVEGRWVTFIVSTLYQELLHVEQMPDVRPIGAEELHRFEVEAHRLQLAFNVKLRAFIGTMKNVNVPRWLAELDVIDENLREFESRYRNGQVPNVGTIRLRK